MEKVIHDTVMETRPVTNYITRVKISSGVPSVQDRLLEFEKRVSLTNENCSLKKNFQSLLAVPSIKDRLQSFERTNTSTMVNERRKVFEKPSYYNVPSVENRLEALKKSSGLSHVDGQKSATTNMFPAVPGLGFRLRSLKASYDVGRSNKTWPPNVTRIYVEKSRDRSDVKVMSGAVEQLRDVFCSRENAEENVMKNYTPCTASLGGGEIDRGNVTREMEPMNQIPYTEKKEMKAVPRKMKPKPGSVMRMVDKFDQKSKQ